MSILDELKLQIIEIKYEYKRLLLGFFVQLSTISILIILLVMSQNVVSIFDQYYHEKISATYNVTIENVEYTDISFLLDNGYFNMYVFMPDLDEVRLSYNGSDVCYSGINLICNREMLDGVDVLVGREYCQSDNEKCNYVVWISEEMSCERGITVGDVIDCYINEDNSVSFTVVGVLSGIGKDDYYVPFNTFCSEPSIQDYNVKFCLSAETNSILNYDSVKYRLGGQNKYMYFDELDNVFSLLFFIKSIFIGLAAIGFILCIVSVSNICTLHINGRKAYINMLYQLGMSAIKIKKLYIGIYLYNIIISVVLAKFIAGWYLSYFDGIIKNEFGNIQIETGGSLGISIFLFFVFCGITRIIVFKPFDNIISVEKLKGIR